MTCLCNVPVLAKSHSKLDLGMSGKHKPLSKNAAMAGLQCRSVCLIK